MCQNNRRKHNEGDIAEIFTSRRITGGRSRKMWLNDVEEGWKC